MYHTALKSSPTGAENSKSFLDEIDLQTAPTFVEESNYEELIPEDSININAGMFFDGTLNNRKNVQARLDYEKKQRGEPIYNEESADAYTNWFGFKRSGSYENDFSNVSRMEPAYEQLNDAKVKQFSIYMDGIGTENYESDSSVVGGGLGLGSTGIRAKVKKGCKELADQIKKKRGDKKINILQIDVYGFSRGAAAARNFIFEINQRKGDFKKMTGGRVPQQINYEVDHGALGEHLSEEEMPRILRIRFTGLYDTVASSGIVHKDDTEELHLNEIWRSNYTFQIASQDEHRENFRLTDIDSAGNRGVEKTLPGVHSDIGGGYNDNSNEEVRINYSGSLSKMEEERLYWIDQGWYKFNEIEVSEFWGTLTGKRQNISNKYSHIPLHIMVEYSKNKNLLYDLGLIKRKYTIAFEANSVSLEAVKARLDEYVFGDGEKMDFNNPADKLLLKPLRNKFFHFSAHYDGIGMNPNIENGERVRVIQDG